MDGFASLDNLFIENPGVGVVDDTLQQFAESGKFLVVQAVEHMNVGFDGFGRLGPWNRSPSCRVDVPHVCGGASHGPGTCRFELGVDEQDVEFVDFVDDLSALVDHDIPLYLVILSSIIAHSVG